MNIEIYKPVLDLLATTNIPKTRRKVISDTPVRTITLGLIHKQFSSYKGLSKATHDNYQLYQALLKLANDINPNHIFSTVTINKDVLCSKHKDRKNNGTTLIVGLGDYEDGELVTIKDSIETLHDIKYKPLYFNGYLTEHYNKPFVGTRYSLMFYSYKGAWDIIHRPQDIPIIKEVYHGNGYHNRDLGFGIESGDIWIDIGAHIGCFSKKAIRCGAQVYAYEPSPTYEVLIKNIPFECCHNLAVCSSNVIEDTLKMKIHDLGYFNKIQMNGSSDKCIDIKVVKFNDILIPDCCIKMDIEGSEMDIIDNDDFSDIKKMVIAYHVNVDSSVANLTRRVAKLRTFFKTVWHSKVEGEFMKFFPNELFIYCSN